VIPTPIETERTVLSPLRERDADEMVTVLADVTLYEFTGGEPPTLDSLTERYRHQVAGSGDPNEVWRNWIIRTNGDGRAVGFVQATVMGDAAEVAWVVGVSDQGRGLATEAATAMCEWLADNAVRRIEAHVHPRHVASQRVAARIGLVPTGRLDEEGEEIWATGP
jgi:RimJ/RimL family protein N-acetyltransferase